MTPILEKIPAEPSDQPPIVLIHGAANSASVWTYWQPALAQAGFASYAVNLRGHGPEEHDNLSNTSMHDYAEDVRSCVEQLDRRPVVMGWSMGGLVAMMIAAAGEVTACIGFAPSTPTRVLDASVKIRQGEFGPEEYGITSREPGDQPAMPDLDIEERQIALASLGRESRRARDERKAGIVIDSLPCPLLIVTGSNDHQWPASTYDGFWIDADYREIDGASHWGLVLNRRALAETLPLVTDWVRKHTPAR